MSQEARYGDVGDQLMRERIIILGEVDVASAQLAVGQLLLMEREDADAPVTLYVNSATGPLDPALSLHGAMQLVSCPIATVCTGVAAGAAVLLVGAGAPGRRAALPHARFVVRLPAPTGQGDLAAAAEEVARTRQTLVELLAAATHHPEETVRSDLERGRFMTSRQAVEWGLIDEVLDQPPKAWRELLSR